jgi:hypothetical protein
MDTRMLRVLIALTVILFLLLWASVATCEVESNNDGIPIDEAAAVAEGEAAPFDGILFPTDLAIQMGFRMEMLEVRLRLDVEREQRLCQASIEFETRRRELEEERRDYQIELLEDRVMEQAEELARPTPWYRRWGFAFGMGILTSSLLVAGGIALIIGVL